MMAHETFEEAQARVKTLANGEAVDRPVAEHHGWHFGERVRVLEDDDNTGVYSGETGVLIIALVGAEKYGNVRTWTGLLLDGTDEPMDVDIDNIEGA